jgi:hypothetical protein
MNNGDNITLVAVEWSPLAVMIMSQIVSHISLVNYVIDTLQFIYYRN